MNLNIFPKKDEPENPKSNLVMVNLNDSLNSTTTIEDYRKEHGADNVENLGFRAASKIQGETQSYMIWLTKLEKAYIIEQKGKDDTRQNKIHSSRAEISNLEEKISHNKKKIADYDEKIESYNEEIAQIKSGTTDKIGLYIGAFILIALSFYLLLFYSSAIYSAIFRVIEPGTEIFTTIFYPKAISAAFHQDVFEGFLVLFAPFIFIGLGYLIHKFSENHRISDYLKMTGVLIVTFIFDVIIAYAITKEIYDANNIIKAVPDPAYSLSIAFSSINFWLIIFAGFVVYIVWGLILSFVIKEFNPSFRKNHLINAVKNKIKNVIKQKSELSNNNSSFATQINDFNGRIKQLENTIFVDLDEIEKTLSAFSNGWLSFLRNGNYKNIDDCCGALSKKISYIRSNNFVLAN